MNASPVLGRSVAFLPARHTVCIYRIILGVTGSALDSPAYQCYYITKHRRRRMTVNDRRRGGMAVTANA